MSSVALSFFAKPENVVKFLQARKPQLHFDYDEIMHEAHSRVFTVAKITKIDLLNDIQKSLSEAYKEGQRFSEWQKDIRPLLAKKGWLGDVSVTNPNTGETKQIYVGSRRLRRIFNTNMRVSIAKARYESQMNSYAQYFRYVAILDSRVRPNHKKLHGLILPKTDKFWDKNYPPNDWGCRCKVQVLTEDELKSEGWQVSKSTPLNIADKDWAYNVGKADNKDKILKEKIKKIDKDSALAKAALSELKTLEQDRKLYVWQQGLNDMLKVLISGSIIKDKAFQVVQVGELRPKIKKALNNQGITPKANSIAIYQNTISHINRDSKPKAKKPNIDEIKAIVSVFDRAKHVYYDSQENVLLYFYSSLQQDKMVNYAVVRLDYVLKKFKSDNFIATISKMPDINYKGFLRDKKRYKRIR